MTIINANRVEFLRTIGIDARELGCVMLELTDLPVKDWLPEGYAYFPNDTKMNWIKGLDVTQHLTLLYGLLMPAWNTWPYGYREGVEEVLRDWAPPASVMINDLEVFPSPLPETEPYKCLVARVVVDDHLLEGHQRLSMLPHINTYLEYKPHVTLGYVHRAKAPDAYRMIMDRLGDNTALRVTGVSLGDRVL